MRTAMRIERYRVLTKYVNQCLKMSFLGQPSNLVERCSILS